MRVFKELVEDFMVVPFSVGLVVLLILSIVGLGDTYITYSVGTLETHILKVNFYEGVIFGSLFILGSLWLILKIGGELGKFRNENTTHI